jgi:hypothetical protein
MTMYKWSDRYYDPPEEPEPEYCETCNQELRYEENIAGRGYTCDNPYCPDKLDGLAKQLAEKILDLRDEVETKRLAVSRMERYCKMLELKIEHLNFLLTSNNPDE